MDIKPENLISLLQQHKPLPQAQVLLLCGEEDYYRNSIIAALPEYVFGDTPEADREITVFDKDTNISGLQAAVNSYPFFCGKSLIFLRTKSCGQQSLPKQTVPLMRRRIPIPRKWSSWRR